ncbi:tetratricopeptide repeat protein 5-like [Achroia grisella]|uniref:tetratricopeptide repeat protein 5-like n=1 Tax=Achroia grisella TaxID=688607 RepID=UPI0027D275CB|nr:tetratricopeptide repeat protein 5-like [Achroia grisella]
MSQDSEGETETEFLVNITEFKDELEKELYETCSFRDLFFENHPIEMASKKNEFVEAKKNALLEKFEAIDVDTQVPTELRAHFLYLKGRCYNLSPTYDPRATQSLSKAVKLNPRLVAAWNELGDCYWKNMNVKDAKASFEGALKHERNRLSLRCLSIILRQESGDKTRVEASSAVLNSVELAKEAVAQDIKDGMSWTVLGNAYLCQFFTVAQEPATLKLCMSAYRQACLDPAAKGQPDLYYNKGIALKYEENYAEALENFAFACELEPAWETPREERARLVQYLANINELIRTKGKIKNKKLAQMVQSIDDSAVGPGRLQLVQLVPGRNVGTALGVVVGSIHNVNSVPFTFAIVDESMECVCVSVYNWADGRGVIIGDYVSLPNPQMREHQFDSPLVKYNFKSIRLNNPMSITVNGKRVGRDQYAGTKATSTYELK